MRQYRERLQLRVDPQLKAQLQAAATSSGKSMSELASLAIEEYLNPDEYKKTSLEMLARMDRVHALMTKRSDMILETLGKFALVWFMNTPDIPNRSLKVAIARSGMARFEKFVDKIAVSIREDSVVSAFEERFKKADEQPTDDPE